ncbi:MAG TPA: EamA family transporter [Acetobacteraceae bacterium]|nr:EamA family transporter [Acetobacteraceae bacterium]
MTVAAAVFQCWRTAMQAKLRGLLSVNGSGFTRFLYGLPASLAFLALFTLAGRGVLPTPSWPMVLYAACGGFMQIIATNLLIMAFGFRNFAVGTAYAKTEAAQAALIALVVLHQSLPGLAWAGILVSVGGVLLLSLGERGLRLRQLLRATAQPAALSGLAAAFCFAVTAVLIQLATHRITGGNVVTRALYVLAATTALQTLMQGGYLLLRDRAELRRTLLAWRRAAWVGVASAAGSACWFTAFSLTNVGLVRALGQIEVLFTLLAGHFYLRERIKLSEANGLLLVALGVVLILIASA